MLGWDAAAGLATDAHATQPNSTPPTPACRATSCGGASPARAIVGAELSPSPQAPEASRENDTAPSRAPLPGPAQLPFLAGFLLLLPPGWDFLLRSNGIPWVVLALSDLSPQSRLRADKRKPRPSAQRLSQWPPPFGNQCGKLKVGEPSQGCELPSKHILGHRNCLVSCCGR